MSNQTKDWLIVDGYNLLYSISSPHKTDAMARLRQGILLRLEPLVNVIARRITVVFDGKENSFDSGENRIVEVIYSGDDSADSVIENLIWKAGHPENILVVTSDRSIRDAVSARGADTMASSLFIDVVEEESSNMEDKIRKINKQNNRITLQDFFPPVKHD